jgi:phosphatidylglycerophosphate synthase
VTLYPHSDGGKVPTVRTGPAVGLIAQVALLFVLAGTVGLTLTGWLLGIACGLMTSVALARGLVRLASVGLGPADRVTLARATLVGAVAALIADTFVRPAAVPTLVGLSVVALVLDAVDGWVARRTKTASPLGARFDMEVDAFLICVLSVYVSRSVGPWVLAIGAARYVFVVVGWLLPWMRASLPPRYWRKTVAAIQGIVLTIAVADVLPRRATEAVLVAALGLLAESFGRDVWWLWRESVRSPVIAERRPIAVSLARH